nr:hypothetical protein [Corynebacterium lactis]
MNFANTVTHESLIPASGFRLLHTLEVHNHPVPKTAHTAPRRASSRKPAPPLPPEALRDLGLFTQRVFDMVGGRRRIDGLRKMNVDAKTTSALLTLSKASHLKGVTLQSFHPSPAASGAKVEFIGSCSIGSRVRAFTGTFTRRKENGSPTWYLTAFRVI